MDKVLALNPDYCVLQLLPTFKQQCVNSRGPASIVT